MLCAGNRMINNKPVFLNTHPDGRLVAEKAIEGIYPERYDRIVYTILNEDDKKYGAAEIICRSCSNQYPVEIVILNNPTSGPAETVYETVKKARIDGELVVRDSLNLISLSKEMTGNFVAGLNLTKCGNNILDLQRRVSLL